MPRTTTIFINMMAQYSTIKTNIITLMIMMILLVNLATTMSLTQDISFSYSIRKTRETSEKVFCQNNVMKQMDHYFKQLEIVPNGKQRFPDSIPKLIDACK